MLKNVRILWMSPLSWNDSVEAVRCCVLKETEFFAPIHLDSIASIPGTTQASSFLSTYVPTYVPRTNTNSCKAT